jgi:tripartite-type tricarboxylate transporter receptor subunit TctC
MKGCKCRFLSAAMLPTALFVSVAFLPTHAHSQANFYEGKTITLIAFTAPGGSGDLRVKAAVPFLKKHIPGNPTVVIEYMDGGGGRKGANHLYHSARPDGLTIGGGSGAIVGLGIMREQGVSYDVDKFIYLGTPESENHAVIYTRTELGLDNLEKLKAKPGIRIGGQTVGHTSYVAGRFFAYFLDMKEPKFIVGYTSPEVDLALLNGELDARANAAVSVLRRNPEWLEKRVMTFTPLWRSRKGLSILASLTFRR